MKRGLIILLLCLIGCSTNHLAPHKDVSPAIIEHAGAISTAATTIDGIVKGSTYAEPVKVQTDSIRTNTEGLQDQAKRVRALEQANQRLREDMEEGRAKALKDQQTLLSVVAVVALVLAGILLYLRQRELAGIAAMVSILALGWVQIISLWYFPFLIGFVTVAGVGVLLWSGHRQKTETETSTIVFSELENYYNAQTQEGKEELDNTLFLNLSKRMNVEHKAHIKNMTLS